MRLHVSLSLLFLGPVSVSSFVVKHENVRIPSKLTVGGPGWDNNSYLDNLGGDGDQEGAKEAYQEFKETRKAFAERMQERMNTEAGQKFMQQQRPQQEVMNEEIDDDMMDIGGREPSRFRHMMEQSSRRMAGGHGQPRPEWMKGPPGLEQKLAIPLDDEEEEEDGIEE